MINIGTSTINAVKLGTTNISAVYIGTTRLFPALDWFYLEDASGSANTVSITKNDANAPTLTIETSTNGYTWTTAGTTGTTALDISVPVNGKVYVRCNANAWSDGTNYNAVSSTGDFNVGGNIMSLLYGSNFTGSETSFPASSTRSFYNMFYGASHLVDASALELPATTLVDNCYQNMFRDCTSLTSAPALPATTLSTGCYQQMFMGCTNLTSRPATLPATTLTGYCYQSMFQNCSSLTSAPALPATTLASYCYHRMFSGCTALTSIPATLPATTLTSNCYYGMFSGCSLITTTPTLPATTLTSKCYNQMFRDCTSLTSAPALPATTLADDCYNGMFYGCTALTTASELPATTLPIGCYGSMYRNTAITTAPLLPATTLGERCYGYMFNGCTSLNSITCLATDISATDCTRGWVGNVAATGTFYKTSSMSSWTTGSNGIPTGWTSANYVDWFYVEDASGATNTVSIVKNDANAPTLTIETSTNGYTWTTLGTTSTTALNISVPANGKVYVRCNANAWSDGTNYNSITATGDFNVGGNIMSLLYGSNFTGAETAFPSGSTHIFYRIFFYASHLVDASALELPATTLVDSCYASVFQGCTSLTAAPELPATTLVNTCYRNMFYGCTHLNSITCLATDISATNCTNNWVNGVAATGTFRKDYTMYDFEINSNNGIPTGWTIQDANAPDYTEPFYLENPTNNPTTIELVKNDSNAPTLSIQTSLDGTTWTTWGSTSTTPLHITVPANGKRYIRCNTAVWANGSAYNYFSTSIEKFNVGGNIMSLLYGSNFTGAETAFPWVSSGSGDEPFRRLFTDNTKLYKASALLLPATTLTEACYTSMFYGCTSLIAAPTLPFTTFAKYSCECMFKGCTHLTSIKVAFTSWPNLSSGATTLATYDWTYGLPASGTFYKKSGLSVKMNAPGNTTSGQTTLEGFCNAIPYDWTVTNY